MDEKEILRYAIEHDMIDESYVQEQIEMKKRKELLEKHPYKIGRGQDGFWYTYLPDEEKKQKRVKRRRRTKQEIENVVIKYWADKEENPTVKADFDEWIEFKSQHNIQRQTVDRYRRDFKTYLSNIGKKKIKNIDECELNDFLVDMVYSHKMTAKTFSNVRIIVRGIWIRAKKKKLIDYKINDILDELELSNKDFNKTAKKEQVYTDREQKMMTDYLKNNLDPVNLGILLVFATGLRVGELSALKTEDVYGNKIHISRTEVTYEVKRGKYAHEVRNFPKTEAGIRDVYIPNDFSFYFGLIKKQASGNEWLFQKDGKRICAHQYQNRLRYICIKKLNIPMKSMHKIRKTYASCLIDEGVPESVITSQMGHTSIETTKKFYYYNHHDEEEMENMQSEVKV